MMICHPSLAVLAGALLALWPCLVLGVDTTRNPDLVAKLRTAATGLDQRELLPNDSDWLYDYPAECTNYTFSPGSVCNANAATFPATVNNGMTMSLLSLGPCSMLPMHYHPRASNYVVATFGTTRTYMIQENGAGVVQQTLTPGKMTIFPQGSVHMMMNLGCTNAQLISALNSPDTGTLNLGYAMQHLPNDLYNSALGNQNISTAEVLATIWPVGTGSNAGPNACLAACASQKEPQPTGTCAPPMPSGDSSGSGYGSSSYTYSPGGVPTGDIIA